MSDYRDESDFDWDYSQTPPSSDDDAADQVVVPYHAEPPPQYRQPTARETLAQMRGDLVQANGIIKQAATGAGQITSGENVQEILAELEGHEREQAMRLASAIGNNAFQYFFAALHQLDQLVMSVYEKEQQLELALYRTGGLSKSRVATTTTTTTSTAETCATNSALQSTCK